ncbi:MAG: elongator complex protein 3 [Hominenteromicrobium sp.]
MKHANISIFIPHSGCPEQCSFCNQRRITGKSAQPTAEAVRETLRGAAEQMGGRARHAQIAFFGGSFTAIDRDYMTELLQTAHAACEQYGFSGIRCSTRPDAVDRERLSLLKAYGVTAIELGAQSMEDAVLRLNRRGHTAQDVCRASALIQAQGFELGLQMMTGLPGGSDREAVSTAKALLALRPDTMRIYPTIVLENTQLCDWYRAGLYTPQTLESAVSLCAELIQMIEAAGVRLIRVGLHASEELENRVAGPYHPAFMELCRSRIFLSQLLEALSAGGKREAAVEVNPRMLSTALGQKRRNIQALQAAGFSVQIRPAADVPGRTFRIL